MKTVELQYLEHPNLALRFLELEAIVEFTYEGNLSLFVEENEQLDQRLFYWQQAFNEAKRPDYIALRAALSKGEIGCLEDFYKALSKLNKPKVKGKALRDKRNDQPKMLIKENSLVTALLIIHHLSVPQRVLPWLLQMTMQAKMK